MPIFIDIRVFFAGTSRFYTAWLRHSSYIASRKKNLMIILFNSGSLVISSNRLLSCRVMKVFTEASEQNDICISALPSKHCFI